MSERVSDWTIALLAEHALTRHDVARIAGLHEDQQVNVYVLVPVDTAHSAIVEAIDEAALGRLRDAVHDSGEASPETARARARDALRASVDALRAAGLSADGALVENDPVDGVVAAAREQRADEVVVISEPHLLEETFRRDWASRIRSTLDLPVLHAVAGTDRVVS